MASAICASIDDKMEDSHASLDARALIGLFGFYYVVLYPAFKTVSFALEKITKESTKKFMDDYKLMTTGCLKTAITGDYKYVWEYTKR